MTGSSARFSSSTSSPAAERSSSTPRTAEASAWVRPIAANTTLNGSPPADAWAASCAASSRWGRPATEKMGSFCPRTTVVSASITEIPVSTGSAGGSRSTGLIGEPATGMLTSPVMAGPPSTGSPRPLHTRPSQPVPTGIRSGLPLKATRVVVGAIPSVPSRTCTTARSRSTSRTSPCRVSPAWVRIVANSSQPTPRTPRTTRSGPRSSATSVYSRCAQAVMAPLRPGGCAAPRRAGRA